MIKKTTQPRQQKNQRKMQQKTTDKERAQRSYKKR